LFSLVTWGGGLDAPDGAPVDYGIELGD